MYQTIIEIESIQRIFKNKFKYCSTGNKLVELLFTDKLIFLGQIPGLQLFSLV